VRDSEADNASVTIDRARNSLGPSGPLDLRYSSITTHWAPRRERNATARSILARRVAHEFLAREATLLKGNGLVNEVPPERVRRQGALYFDHSGPRRVDLFGDRREGTAVDVVQFERALRS